MRDGRASFLRHLPHSSPSEELVTGEPAIVNGVVPLPHEPGIEIEIVDEAVARQRVL